MKILVAGNSQAGALRLAVTSGLLGGAGAIRPHFFVVPGGTGPQFILKDRRLIVTSFNEKFPPYTDPAEISKPLIDDYDAIIVSALGYVDGGFLYLNAITHQGYLAEFRPRLGIPDRPLLSETVFTEVVKTALLLQPGFVFLKALAGEFRGRILVQPFPYSSSYLTEREDWELRRLYEDFLGFNRFLFRVRDVLLREICDDLGVELLPPPDPAWAVNAFTPRELMRESDGVHPMPEYGAMVLRQIALQLEESPRITPFANYPEVY